MNYQRLLFGLMLLLLLPIGSQAQPANTAQSTVQEILNTDGTIRLDREGGYSVEGYELQLDANGAPRLTPKGDAQAQNTTGTWSSVGTSPGNGVSGGSSPLINAMAVYNGDLYVGGSFSFANWTGDATTSVSASNIARWNGTSWSSVGAGVSGDVYAMAVYKGELYVGGGFTQAGGAGANRMARWNGTSWSRLGPPTANGVNSVVYALAVYNDTLYVGGQFTTAGGMSVSANYIARWDGTNWSSVGSGSSNGVGGGSFPSVYALAVYNGELYVGGGFTQAGGASANRMARWDGTNWGIVGSGSANGVSGSFPYINALAVYLNELYVGGVFSSAGGTSANNIARWNGTSWNRLGTSTANGVNIGSVNALTVYNGELYVGGVLEFANWTGDASTSLSANRIVRWNGTSWSRVGTSSNGVGGGLNPSVNTLAVYNSELYVGGQFTSSGGTSVTANRIARWSISGAPFSYSHNITTSINTYTFFGTGITVEFTGLLGSGHCTVERYDSPAQNVTFTGTPPTVQSQYRFIINASGFTFTSALLRFNRTQIPNAGITNPQTVNVYRRPTAGTGAFSMLTNNYNSSFPDEVRATTTAFSEFILASDDASNQLPVELTSFTARKTGQGVELAWRTASELNNSGFEVERKSQGADWNTLGFVRGAGTTTEAQSYSFLDKSATGKVQYRLKQIDFDGQFEYSNIIEVDAGLPKQFALEQNYPNPFNPSTTISYQLSTASTVSLKLYDVLGKEVATLVNGRQEAGTYNFNFNASNLASGVYFYRLQASATNGASGSNFVQTKKMMLVK